MFVHLTIAITAQLLYGCWISIQPVQSQTKRGEDKYSHEQNIVDLVLQEGDGGREKLSPTKFQFLDETLTHVYNI